VSQRELRAILMSHSALTKDKIIEYVLPKY